MIYVKHLIYTNLHACNVSIRDSFAGFLFLSTIKSILPLTPQLNFPMCKHILVRFPPLTKRNQCPPHWSHFVSVSLALLSQNCHIYINASCPVWLTLTESLNWHAWVRDGGLGEDGRSECKQSLSLCRCWEGDALAARVRLGPQDKNVFDIVSNCVIFALLVSERGCVSNQVFKCQLWQGVGFLSGSN